MVHPPSRKERQEGIVRDVALPMPAAAPRTDFLPPTNAPISGEGKSETSGKVVSIKQMKCSREDVVDARTQFISLDATKHPCVTGLDSSKCLMDSIRYFTEIVSKRFRHFETSPDSEV